MSALLDTPSYLTHRDSHRELRVHFASRASLLAGLARARRETWVEDCRADVERRELWIRMAGGVGAGGGRGSLAVPLRVVPGGLACGSNTLQ